MNTGMVSLNSVDSEHAMTEMNAYVGTTAIDYSTGSASHHMQLSAAAASTSYDGYSAAAAESYASNTGTPEHLMDNGKILIVIGSCKKDTPVDLKTSSLAVTILFQ